MRRPAAVKSANLLRWWPLYGTDAKEIIGASNGTLVNAPVAGRGRIDECLDFERDSSQAVSLPTTYVEGLTNFTIACWINLESLTGTQVIYGEVDAVNATPSRINMTKNDPGNKLAFTIVDNADTTVIVAGTTTLAVDTWYWVAITKSGDTKKVFVDGVEEASSGTATGSVSNIDSADIGRFIQEGTPSSWFDGRIQDVMIWDTALTADELKAQMVIGTYPVIYS